MVLMHHLDGHFKLNIGFASGYLSVDVFFVLSGFVIAGAYGDRLKNKLFLTEYAFIRWARLYPVMFLGILTGVLSYVFGVAGQPLTGGQVILSFILQCLFIPTIWTKQYIFVLDPVQWSLFVEVVVNCIHAFTVRLITIKRLIAATLVLAAGLVFVALKYKTMSVGWEAWTLPGGIVRGMFGFTVGLLLYQLRNSGALFRFSLPWPVVAISIPALVLVYSLSGLHKIWWTDLIAVALLTPTIVYLALNTHLPNAVAKVALTLGALSYPLYALQQPIITIVSGVEKRLHATIDPSISAIFAFLLVCTAATACMFFYDRPITGYLNRLHRKLYPPPALKGTDQHSKS